MDAWKRPQFSLGEISYLLSHLELNAQDRDFLKTQYHMRLAQPWTCLIVALIAIPFGAASGRRNVFVGVALSIFICLAYLVLQPLGLALAATGSDDRARRALDQLHRRWPARRARPLPHAPVASLLVR